MRAVIFLVALSTTLWAQARPELTASAPDSVQEPQVKIKAYTKLVEVPVIVTDGSGKHAPGLTREDFRLFEGKSEKKIATFEYVTTSRAPLGFKGLPKGVYSNLLMGGEGPRAISVIVMDSVNTTFLDQARARHQLIKYLTTKIEPGHLFSLMVISRSGVRVIHDYTTDTAVLIKALQRVKGKSESPTAEQVGTRVNTGTDPFESAVEREAAALEDFVQNADTAYESFQRGIAVMDTLAALEGITKSLAGIPGRKSLVWATGSFPFYFDDAKGFSSTTFSSRLARVFESLNDANIAIYPIDVRGLVNPGVVGADTTVAPGQLRNPAALMSARSTAFRNTLDTLKNAAEMTGGVAYYNTNDIAGSFRKAAEDSASYYVLGYYLTGTEGSKPTWHKLSVQTRRPGLKVRARKGVFANPPTLTMEQKTEALQVAERSPLPYTAMAMVVRWPGYAGHPGTYDFEVRLDTSEIQLSEPENAMNLDVLVVARAADGTLLDQSSQTISGKVMKAAEFRTKPLIIANKLNLSAAPATVRFIVRDNNSGKMGSVIVTAPSLK